MTTINAPMPTDPRPVRDSLLPAAISLVAVLAVVSGLAAAAGLVVRAVATYVIG
ncbi:hypothetical protein [Ruania halotolerans]|uniref:hypothetical protein n=1 Tax=Ruania halotolerans TaxID=2897773 RepID=UPI001E5F5EDB|nr:hypothetical protein [Ruania halotolerans]UFU05816.1 hypothetical protein LQF10_15480 [Ruania halotolerans]